jgi:uncharacterized membrane protein
LRNEGGSVGTSLAQTFQERRDQFHTLRLGEYLDPFNAAANSFIARAQAFFAPADRRSSRVTATGVAATRKHMPAASIGACLLRQLLDVGRVDVWGRVRGTVYETFCG